MPHIALAGPEFQPLENAVTGTDYPLPGTATIVNFLGFAAGSAARSLPAGCGNPDQAAERAHDQITRAKQQRYDQAVAWRQAGVAEGCNHGAFAHTPTGDRDRNDGHQNDRRHQEDRVEQRHIGADGASRAPCRERGEQMNQHRNPKCGSEGTRRAQNRQRDISQFRKVARERPMLQNAQSFPGKPDESRCRRRGSPIRSAAARARPIGFWTSSRVHGRQTRTRTASATTPISRSRNTE